MNIYICNYVFILQWRYALSFSFPVRVKRVDVWVSSIHMEAQGNVIPTSMSEAVRLLQFSLKGIKLHSSFDLLCYSYVTQ